MNARAVIMVNVGTPDTPSERDVRRFLREFLNDPKVIDIPWLLRKVLVDLIIVPFRTSGSSGLYRRLWTDKGSPLLVHLKNLVMKDEDWYGAMRYGNPSLVSVLKQVKEKGYEKITILPLFPQYASSTSGSVIELVRRETDLWDPKPEISIVEQFYTSPAFIRPMADRIRETEKGDFDRVVFSYHGLPVRHIRRVHPSCNPETCGCDEQFPGHTALCYRAACHETSRLLAGELGLGKEKYITTFQSRLTRNWLGPFTDESLVSLAKSGVKRVVIAAPSFVADCLETTVEIGEEYRKLFIESGGDNLMVVPCLNEELDVNGILEGFQKGTVH